MTKIKQINHKAELEKERKQRAENCAKAIDAVLKEYNCTLAPQAFITQQGTVSANVGILANE